MLLGLGIALTIAWLAVGAFEIHGTGDDWRLYLDAGRHVGSITLLTQAHFVYAPGAAWAMWPFAHLPSAAGYFVYAAIMVGLAIGAAWLASKAYGISLRLAVFMALAWFPLTIAVSLGQNSPLALFLTMATVLAIVRRADVVAGLLVGLLFYKPNDALPFLLLFVMLKQWRSVAVAAACVPVWYLLSVGATGDWTWPATFSRTFATWYHYDAGIDAVFSINVPGILLHMGMSSGIAISVGAILFLLTMPLLLSVSRIEAASIAPLVGLTCSPHAYGYEAILALPALWLAASRPSALRITAISTAYCLAPLYVFARKVGFDAIAIPILGGFVAWTYTRLRAIFFTRTPATARPSQG